MFTTTILNQEVQVYFNTSIDCDYECRIDHYAIKVDLSDKDFDDYESFKSDFIFTWQTTCLHGLREQEVIFVFNVPKEEQVIYKPHLLEEALTNIVKDINESFKGSKALGVPYVIEIGITNAEPEL